MQREFHIIKIRPNSQEIKVFMVESISNTCFICKIGEKPVPLFSNNGKKIHLSDSYEVVNVKWSPKGKYIFIETKQKNKFDFRVLNGDNYSFITGMLGADISMKDLSWGALENYFIMMFRNSRRISIFSIENKRFEWSGVLPKTTEDKGKKMIGLGKIQLSPNNIYAAIGQSKGRVVIFDITKKNIKGTIDTAFRNQNTDLVSLLEWSNGDGKLLAYTSVEQQNEIKIWNINSIDRNTWALKAIINTGKRIFTKIKWTLDNTKIITQHLNSIAIWDIQVGKNIRNKEFANQILDFIIYNNEICVIDKYSNIEFLKL